VSLGALYARDVRLAWGAGGGGPVGVIFYLAVTAVAPFALGPDLPLLSRLGPALLTAPSTSFALPTCRWS
jgi:heme exporter protein B